MTRRGRSPTHEAYSEERQGGSTVRYVVLLLLLFVLASAGGVYGILYFGITMGQIRDGVIIVYGAVGVLFFLVGIIVLLAILLGLRAASDAGSDVFNETVRPLTGNAREMADDAREMVGDVRGMVRTARTSVEFVSDNAVSPVIRAVSVARGFRRGFGSVLAASARRQPPRE